MMTRLQLAELLLWNSEKYWKGFLCTVSDDSRKFSSFM